MTALVDTCILLDLIGGNEVVRDKLDELIQKDKYVNFCGLTYYEVKKNIRKKSRAKQEVLTKFLAANRLILLDSPSIFERAVAMYEYLHDKGRPIGDADILIASCAMEGNNLLVSRDKDFGQLEPFGLRFESW